MINGVANPHHPLWGRWATMKNVCDNPNNRSYSYYGGRGITYAPEWSTFEQFVEGIESTIGPVPFPGAHLDRIDNDRGYFPGNVRWATPKENHNNRRSNMILTAFGKTMTLTEWSKYVGLKSSTIWSRIIDLGHTPEQALTTTKYKRNK